MIWLTDLPDGDTDWERFASRFPEPMAALAATVDAVYRENDEELITLARARIATLLGGTAPIAASEKIDALPSWPTSPLFAAKERACLALTEQFVMDANSVTGETVDAVSEHLGVAGCYAFVEAVSVLETFQRACLTLGIETMPTTTTTGS